MAASYHAGEFFGYSIAVPFVEYIQNMFVHYKKKFDNVKAIWNNSNYGWTTVENWNYMQWSGRVSPGSSAGSSADSCTDICVLVSYVIKGPTLKDPFSAVSESESECRSGRKHQRENSK